MGLYGFAATPIQFWHQHKYAGNSQITYSSSDKGSGIVSTASVNNSEDSCQICSHQYSAYNDNAVVIFATPLFFTKSKEEPYSVSIISSPHFNFSNKGPPALA